MTNNERSRETVRSCPTRPELENGAYRAGKNGWVSLIWNMKKGLHDRGRLISIIDSASSTHFSL